MLHELIVYVRYFYGFWIDTYRVIGGLTGPFDKAQGPALSFVEGLRFKEGIPHLDLIFPERFFDDLAGVIFAKVI